MAQYLGMLIDTLRERVVLRNSQNCLILGSGRQVPFPPCTSCKDVAATSGPHVLPRMICSQRTGRDVPSLVAAEDALACSFKQSTNAGPSVRRMCTVHQLLGSGGMMGIGNSSPDTPPSLLLYIDVSVTSWSTYLQDLIVAGVWP